MAEAFVAEIRIVPFNFAPKGWALCNGQILSISQNTALFSLLGTTYGGDGRSNFALPNLQGRSAIGQGQGPGLTDRSLGDTDGVPAVTLSPAQIPSHQHTYNAGSGGRGGVTTIAGNVNGDAPFQTNIYGTSSDGTVMSPNMIQPTPP